MVLRDVIVRLMPRMLDIETMIDNSVPASRMGLRVEPTALRRIRELQVDDRVSLKIGNLKDPRTVDILYGPQDCPQKYKPQEPTTGGSVGDTLTGEAPYCVEGNALSLFPSTYVYITATMVDPDANHWDVAQGRFVTGPVETKVFYQFAGIKPDFNNNGVDDLLDLRAGTSRDVNGNGVPDEAERDRGREPCPCDLKPFERLFTIGLVLFALLIVVIVILMIRRR